MEQRKNIQKEIQVVFIAVIVIFLIFLLWPLAKIISQSFQEGGSLNLSNYIDILTNKNVIKAIGNSLWLSSISAILTTIMAFCLAYTLHYTNVFSRIKRTISILALLPMLLPTITYGFALIYSFGKEGLFSRLMGFQLISIYGYVGLIMGYIIYTLPISFILLSNSMAFIDKKYLIVSRLMLDKPFHSFRINILRPLLGTLAASFIQCFFLSFTDFGIPESVRGKVQVIASVLYGEMLGSIPNIGTGSVIAILMLLPSIISISLLKYLEKYNIRYDKISNVEMRKNRSRDIIFGAFSVLILVFILSIFSILFIIPFMKEWPYNTTFTLDNFKAVLGQGALVGVYRNSLIVAIATAFLGTIVTYGAALLTSRNNTPKYIHNIINSISLITNTIPGMVLGVGYLLVFSGTPIQNTFFIMIICNVIHFFSTPYLMFVNSLSKMNTGWEVTARLMGDNWINTVIRIITPNTKITLLEVFDYYFINAMVTISAIVFIAGARTMVITTKIKELQYFAEFNNIFVLSLLLLLTNIGMKCLFKIIAKYFEKKKVY